jgi:hypothetical protein
MPMKMRWIAGALALATSAGLFAQQHGDWVLARWKGDRYWFPGVVESRAGDRITIAYDDGTRETLPARLVRPYDWSVGSRVSCQWQGGSEWYAGRIAAMGGDGVTLEIAYDDGDRERTRTGSCRSE